MGSLCFARGVVQNDSQITPIECLQSEWIEQEKEAKTDAT